MKHMIRRGASLLVSASLIASPLAAAPAGAASTDPTVEQIKALGLPSYTGETKLDANAGRLEAAQLAVGAMGVAGARIAADNAEACASGCILVGQADTSNFTEAAAISIQISAFAREFVMLRVGSSIKVFAVLPGLVAGVSALAGMARTESTVTGVALTELDDSMLVLAVAHGLGAKATLPGAMIGKLDLDKSEIAKNLEKLIVLNGEARDDRDKLQREVDAAAAGDPTTAGKKVRIAELSSLIKRFDDFYAKINLVNDSGSSPIVRALRMESIFGDGRPILRVRVNVVGGSLTNSKNLWTFFGADPIRIGGGLIVSYMRTNPDTGILDGSGIYNCRAARTTLRRVQAGDYSASADARGRGESGDKANTAKCRAVIGTPEEILDPASLAK